MAKNNRPDRNSRTDRRNDAPRPAQPHASQPHTTHASGGMAAHSGDQQRESQQREPQQGTQQQGAQQAAATAVATGVAQHEHTAAVPTAMKSKKGNQPKHSPKR
ncbi:hypothetical protein Cs7R123_57790 [Catellatospora sp. TT07R-123]|uniref:hypothetical protein n=1 Tax=Catellatospora sp. TT07R-123 TaxID=2733863 RepID=UPI001B08ED4E|nr:hypothetical protein [Catellatospora sp. TT07R-123]GHJ48437.1 hypothetical protein Cs7R123_57790 [Catellatospora sp. TT07R-123]